MKKRYRILPYKNGSESAAALSNLLGILRVNPDPAISKFNARASDTIINWGNSTKITDKLKGTGLWLNHPTCIINATDKRKCLGILSEAGVPVPDWTTDRIVAEDWVNGENLDEDIEGTSFDVVVRHRVASFGGNGVEIVDRIPDPTEDDVKVLPQAPLYTKYIPKKHEYRVHVLPNGTSSIRQKRRSSSFDDSDVDWRIRTHDNGFIFAREMSYLPEGIGEIGVGAVHALGLDFGAVDIIYNEKRNQCYVLEVNTAPGIEGETINEYGNAFKERLGI